MINYVRRTLQPVVLKSASSDAQFGDDEYIVTNKARSVVCMPILLKNSLKVFNLFSYFSFGIHHLITHINFIQGVMYLENNLCDELYNNNHVDLLKVLTSQMAISLENIRFLHDQMEKQSERMR